MNQTHTNVQAIFDRLNQEYKPLWEALATPSRNDATMDALSALTDAEDALTEAKADYLEYRDETGRMLMQEAQMEVTRLRREAAGMLAAVGEEGRQAA